MKEHPLALKPEQLRRRTRAEDFPFKDTREVEPLDEIIGQPRGTEAIAFGVNMHGPGYNVFVTGPPGTGRLTTIRQYVRENAASEEPPQDWLYVTRFDDLRRPRALALPAGEGQPFAEAMRRLVGSLKGALPAAFQTAAFTETAAAIEREFKLKRDAVSGEIREMSQPAVEANLSRALHEIGEIEAEAAEKLDVLRQDVAGQVLERQLSPIRSKALAAGYEETVADFLDAMRADVLDHLELFFEGTSPAGSTLGDPTESDPAVRYGVNVLVENDPEAGAPVEIINLPTIPNLVGRIEHQVYAGALITHPGLIRAGALHRANGGFLIIDATEFLDFPEAWVALKRALKTGEVRFEAPDGMQPGIMTTEGIDPEPIPLDIKVILQGPDWIYHWIFSEDDDFYELFKVKADFDYQMDRTPENERAYARFVAARCTEENLPPFEAGAVARLVDYGSWLVEDQAKLSARFSDMADIIRESVYHAQKQNPQPEAVTAADVDAALDAREFRSNLVAAATWEEIRRGQIYIDTEGEVIGQVNGLTIYDDGNYAFGQPTRITARTYMGREGVNQIDREVDLSGPIHNKGVLTLRGYLGGHYAQRKSLALSASITFEQTYGPIDGDSAASAELYALLSSLAQLPIKQGIGVTGSVNQLGQVQPIGGVSAKIEGFFEICKSRGLTGDQGVLIPRTNITNLSLKDEVIEAVEADLFTIYAIDTVEEGIELLTGVPAGSNLPDGTYPEGSIHQIVFKRLEEMANEDSSSDGNDNDDDEEDDEDDDET